MPIIVRCHLIMLVYKPIIMLILFSYILFVNKERLKYICFLTVILVIELFSYLNTYHGWFHILGLLPEVGGQLQALYVASEKYER